MAVDVPALADVSVVEVTDTGDVTFTAVESRGPMGGLNVRASLRLALIRAVAYSRAPEAAEVWDRADGMGSLPPEEHGFDWSAIRDSSPGAKARMYARAVQAISRAEFTAAIGLDDPAPDTDATYLATAPAPESPGEPVLYVVPPTDE